jgi:hypothetical protein
MGHQHWGDDDSKAGLTHRLADGVIVGELIRDRLEAPDPCKSFPRQRDGCANAWPGQAKREPKDRAGQEMIVHRYRGQVRPEAAARQAAIETGDHSDAGLRQGAHQHPQILWTNRHIAVSHDDERMTSDLPPIDEVGDLTVNPMRGAVDDEMKFKLG